MSNEYVLECWSCLGEYDAAASVWCSCDPRSPTKLCPYCMQCFCRAPDEYKSRFWQSAPESLLSERASLRTVKDRLGELLVRAQIITVEELLAALDRQTVTGDKLGQLFINEKAITHEELTLFLQMQSVVIPTEFRQEHVDLNILNRLNKEFCLQRRILPLQVFHGAHRSFLALAMSNPQDLATIDIVNRKTGIHVVPFYCDEFAISSFLNEYAPDEGAPAEEVADYQAIIRKIIVGAIKHHASDIHLEPGQNEVNVRYRIDGVLYKVKSFPKNDQGPLVTSLKMLAKMDLRSSPIPQSTKMVLRLEDQRYQLNILGFPNPHGESVNIKIVNLSTFLRDLSEIGLTEAEYTQVRLALDSSMGLILISGPLMNGCSTTQYAMMRYLSASNRKIMTLESPIFCNIKNVHQSEINPSVGFDFITGLNSIIRSDPDVIFLSDVPEAEVALTICKIAARCVVVAALNANSAANTIVMLRELGATPSLLSQCLSMVINQRLIRRICSQCSEKSPLTPAVTAQLGLSRAESEGLNAHAGSGCKECNFLGFNGRTAIFEVLTSNTKLAETIAKNSSSKELERVAIKSGMVSLRTRCLQKINEQITSIEEFQKCKF